MTPSDALALSLASGLAGAALIVIVLIAWVTIRKTRPIKALVITDGFVEQPDGPAIKSCNIEAIIPATGTPDVLKEYGIPVSTLSPIC